MTNQEPKSAEIPVALIALSMLKSSERDWRGDCYLVSLEFFADAAKLLGRDHVRLCHGTPVAKGKKGSERIGHAWVEVTMPDGLVIVFDLTWGPMPVPAATFYRTGDLEGEGAVVVRYDHAALLAMIEQQMEQYPDEIMFAVGPWDERVSAAAHTNKDGAVERKARTA